MKQQVNRLIFHIISLVSLHLHFDFHAFNPQCCLHQFLSSFSSFSSFCFPFCPLFHVPGTPPPHFSYELLISCFTLLTYVSHALVWVLSMSCLWLILFTSVFFLSYFTSPNYPLSIYIPVFSLFFVKMPAFLSVFLPCELPVNPWDFGLFSLCGFLYSWA